MLETEPQGYWGGNRFFGQGTNQIDLPYHWTPRWYQQKAWDYLKDTPQDARLYLIAHRRWGKDDLALHAAACHIHRTDVKPANYWHMLPEYSMGRKAIWTAVNPHSGIRRIDEAFPKELRTKTLEGTMEIHFKNGSTWSVVGSDNYNTLVGSSPAFVVFSEWALSNPSSWGYIRPMLVENHGCALFISTPRGRNFAFDMASMAEQSDAWHYDHQPVTYTKALTPEQQVEAEFEYKALYGDDIGLSMFRQEYLCDWSAALLGTFWGGQMRRARENGQIRPVVKHPKAETMTVWDIGVKDDTSVIQFQVINGQINILKAYTNNGVGVKEHVEKLSKEGWDFSGRAYVPHDAKVKEWGSSRTRMESIQQLGLQPWLVTNASKMDGIEAARKTIPLCTFDTSTEKTLVAALEQYRRAWDDEKKTFSANEVRDWTTHLADAFRYLSLGWRNAPEYVPKEKPPQPKGSVVLEGAPPDPDDLSGRIII